MSGATNALADWPQPPVDLGGWMQTHSGKAYHFKAPQPASIILADIAHALGNLCRFGGHCAKFYSVAEHSILVSQVVPKEFAMQGLMHDATEAYVIDVPRPLKHLLGASYENLEAATWGAICAKYGLPLDLDPSVKMADNTVLLAEKEVMLGEPPLPWTWAKGLRPAKVDIHFFSPAEASNRFLKRYREIQENT